MEAKQSNKSPFLPLISQFSIIHKSSVKQTVIVGTFEQLCVEQKKSWTIMIIIAESHKGNVKFVSNNPSKTHRSPNSQYPK